MNAYRVGQRVGWEAVAAWSTWIARIAGFLALAVAGAALAQSANSIDQVSVSRGASGNTVVRFTLKAAPRQSAGRIRGRSARRGSRSTS